MWIRAPLCPRYAPEQHPCSVGVGDTVICPALACRGTVAYVGYVESAPGLWVGVLAAQLSPAVLAEKLDVATGGAAAAIPRKGAKLAGPTDGVPDGVFYFGRIRGRRGFFARPSQLKLAARAPVAVSASYSTALRRAQEAQAAAFASISAATSSSSAPVPELPYADDDDPSAPSPVPIVVPDIALLAASVPDLDAGESTEIEPDLVKSYVLLAERIAAAGGLSTGGEETVLLAATSTPETLEYEYETSSEGESTDARLLCKAYAVYTWAPQEDGELGFERGEYLDVYQFANGSWWFGAKADGSQGLFPVMCATPVLAIMAAASSRPAEDDDELSLKADEHISVLAYSSSDWYLGLNSSGDKGLFPVSAATTVTEYLLT
ncbi:uncharacterized protein AMSG_00393 [Thecamonas trahens ATCC 50062]|uniref:SH3 domain-containing protein n=1 Tax=Thecamonas trahens ATCC 50062 TaxID=461836 RepID=A0A0L0D996_THETB|nr:hypothetical protein AMSG_00393 [Thecamonas trahens ATCC 50062]KNC48616.1 hypothetical protein AMSG_00393 [Thecamonas trahens ATCC 50062]|eukprot:XP_013762672.1 hypothetical protein AMSG_00393 [Thecamonas trahens ATCC 50062]